MAGLRQIVIFESVLAQVKDSQPSQAKTVSPFGEERAEHFDIFKDSPGSAVDSYILDNAEKKSEEALNFAIGTIVHINDKVQEQFESQSKKPSTIELSFGIKITGGLATIVKAETECEISVKATWDLKPPSPSGPA